MEKYEDWKKKVENTAKNCKEAIERNPNSLQTAQDCHEVTENLLEELWDEFDFEEYTMGPDAIEIEKSIKAIQEEIYIHIMKNFWDEEKEEFVE